MQVLTISGARNPAGQTSQAVNAVAQGIIAAGGVVETVLLPEMHIERCRQCDDNGWGICRTQGRCVIEDDLPAIKARIRQADLVLFATPVYYADLAESLRAFLDRLRRTSAPEEFSAGIRGKRAIGICVAGGGGGGAPNCCVALERALASTGFDVYDLFPVRRQNLALKVEVLEAYGYLLAKA
ncbi:MAG: flavodoxin family protein [Chloroflexi bacterium]|nr:flavodoxin family protein [Chloroflexota bacterium]